MHQSGYRIEKGGFARIIGADKGQHFPAPDFQRQVPKGLKGPMKNVYASDRKNVFLNRVVQI
jgi:hypothetical protein